MASSGKVLSIPILLTVALMSSSVLADSASQKLARERIFSDAAAEAAREGQNFKDIDQAEQLRHRLNEQSPENVQKAREQHQKQQGKQSKHQYQYREKSGGQHQHQSGSMSRGSSGGNGAGRGKGGGGGKGR